ncbi:hypothetical protein M9H77_25594 [Catharanthus roseus]|uniref:Uncharacterized protein n=1 Tax=Catharanthus roseus TaxID=4058 RepID=A0ACC0A7P8_CATRO|nr:hypothetical protein M9H77_25594 [Catharanthus roseus]
MNRGPLGYLKMEMEDPEELKHRRAQFLIYKALQQADSIRRPSWLKVKTNKFKVKIGKRLKRLRKTILSTISVGEACFYKQLIFQLKLFRRGLFPGSSSSSSRGEAAIVALPPIFTASI